MNKGAALLKKKLDKARVGGADKRARAKKSDGSLSERARKAAKKAPEKRGLPAIRKDNLPEIQKRGLPAVRKDNLPATRKENMPAIRKESLPANRSSTAKTFGPGTAAGGIGGKIARGLFRGVGGPATMLVSMTTPTGDGREDKPSGPLMRGGRQPGYKYRDEQTVSREGKSDMPERIIKVEDYPETAKPRPRPSSDKVKAFKEKMQGRRPAAKPAAKPSVKKPERPSFRGNWVGATPSEMQKRGGARIKRPGNIMSFLRGK